MKIFFHCCKITSTWQVDDHSPFRKIGETREQTERFLILFEKTRFAHNDWRFLE